MKKKAAPKKNWRTTHYTNLDLLLASPVNPLSAKDRIGYLTKVYEALHSLETAENPTRQDWQFCTDAVNIMETLVTDMRACADEDGLIQDAADGLARAGKRLLENGKIRLDGQAIASVRAVVEDYSMCLETFPARIMIEAHRKTEIKVQEKRKSKMFDGKEVVKI